MPLTDRQKLASEALESAIKEAALAFECAPPTCIITEFVVCAEGVRLDPSGDQDEDLEQVFQLFRGGYMRTSHAIGLLQLSIDDLKDERNENLITDDDK